MARKSNKTEHVLNLLSGHDAKTETPEETEASSADASPSTVSETPPKEAPQKEAPGAAAPQTVSVIDTTEEDPLAELIQNKLSDEFEKQLSGEDSEHGPNTSADTDNGQEPADLPVTEEPEAPTSPEPAEQPEPATPPVSSEQPEAPASPEPTEQPEPPASPEPAEQPEPSASPVSSEPVPQPVPEPVKAAPEPEPDFVPVNVMERIVTDKIDYFMNQFEVCKCDRCRADAIALTLTGLQPRYIVTAPAAVDPLLSYYSNKYTADVIVEATKACMVVKEKPRH